MNTKAIIITLVAAAAVIGLMAVGYIKMAGPTQAQLQTKGSLTASEIFFDFGTISMAKGKVAHAFEIANPTDSDIRVNNLETSCMCTVAYIGDGAAKQGPFGMPGMGGMTSADYVVKAHGTANVEVVFDPAAHGPAGVGEIDRLVYVTEANGGTLQFEVKAVVTP